jgi:hypothetical protein
VGGGQSLGIRILVELRNPAVANTEGHHPAVIEHATCILDSAAGPTDHENAVRPPLQIHVVRRLRFTFA